MTGEWTKPREVVVPKWLPAVAGAVLALALLEALWIALLVNLNRSLRESRPGKADQLLSLHRGQGYSNAVIILHRGDYTVRYDVDEDGDVVRMTTPTGQMWIDKSKRQWGHDKP